MDHDLFAAIEHRLSRGERVVLCTIIEENGSTPRGIGSKMALFEDGSTLGTIGGGIVEANVLSKARILLHSPGSDKGRIHCEHMDTIAGAEGGASCGGDVSVFIDPLGNARNLIIFGAGHVGKALARLASDSGFLSVVWDDREEFANKKNIPWGDVLCCPLQDALNSLPFGSSSYSVVVTRGHLMDGDVLSKLETRKNAYVGMIGSGKKVSELKEILIRQGVDATFLDGVFAPIGLSIGAETPEEIAISILSEIVMVSRNHDPSPLRNWNSVQQNFRDS